MSDGLPPNANDTPPNGDATPPAPQSSGDQNISLSREEYAQLTTQLAVAQSQLERMMEQNNRQPEPTKPNPLDGKDVNQMTNQELLELMTNSVNTQVAQPLLNTLMQLAIKEELRDVQERYPDFKEFKKDTYAIAEKNTHLSIEQAYLLAKAGKPAPPPPAAPKVETPPPTPSDKPSVSSGTVNAEERMTPRQAAEAAMKALKYS